MQTKLLSWSHSSRRVAERPTRLDEHQPALGQRLTSVLRPNVGETQGLALNACGWTGLGRDEEIGGTGVTEPGARQNRDITVIPELAWREERPGVA